MTESPLLDIEPAIPAIEPMAELVAASRAGGRGGLAIVRDMLRTTRGSPGKLAMADYFYYRLWDDALTRGEDRRTWVGRGLEPSLHRITADAEWVGVFHDKLLAYHVLERAGFPVPETIALYRQGVALPAMTCLPDPGALAGFLRRSDTVPWFAKPVTGIRSTGTARAEAFDATADQLVLSGDRRVAVEDFAKAVARYAGDGYLFQRVVAPHPEMARLTSGRLAGARLVVLLQGGRAALNRALLKIPVGANIADNFWRSGNLVAAIDSESGRIIRVVAGVGHAMHEVEIHPDSGATLRDAQLPDWRQTVDLCLAAATLFPRIRMQAWDVALSASGPVLMEANVGGDFNLPQIAHARGMLTPGFRAFLAACATDRDQPIRDLLRKIGLDGR